MDKVEVLRRCPLLGGFTDVGLRILAGIAQERRVAAGEDLFSEGDPSEGMFVLSRGRVELLVGEGGARRTLATLEPHEALGELALVTPGVRQVTARAVEAVEALELRRADFIQLQRRKPQACLKLLMAVVQQFGARVSETPALWRSLLDRA